MCPANEIQRGALPPLVSGANRSEVFCDSVGCQVPYRIGLRSFSLLRMGWGYTSRAWLGLSRASVQRRGRRWRCAERQEVVLDPDLFSPETLTQAAEPLQRYTYESLFGGSAASESSAFSVDHQVFGNYGSLWSFFALADPSRWTMADGMTPACPSTCTLAIRAVRLLAEVDQWRNSSPARRLQQLSQLSLLFGKGDQWESLRTWVWPRLTELWKEDASWILQELTEPQRSCFDALNTGKAAEVLEDRGLWQWELSASGVSGSSPRLMTGGFWRPFPCVFRTSLGRRLLKGEAPGFTVQLFRASSLVRRHAPFPKI
ncbi:unnamed protein product [Durusdinium trenchii]|uniref:Uncharacterized protein n=1 Tax=Durusdinium trenchii TaxID=1381693 RepID=A0ABP0MVK4_9DINO